MKYSVDVPFHTIEDYNKQTWVEEHKAEHVFQTDWINIH